MEQRYLPYFIAILIVLSLGFSYTIYLVLNLNQSRQALDAGNSYLETANLACETGDMDRCIDYLYRSKNEFSKAVKNLRYIQFLAGGIYSDANSMAAKVSAITEFVSFSRELDRTKSIKEFREMSLDESPCSAKIKVDRVVSDVKDLEPDLDRMIELSENKILSIQTQEQIKSVVGVIIATKRVAEIFSPAYGAMCTVEQEIIPKIDVRDDRATALALQGDTTLPQAIDTLSASFGHCMDFVTEVETARSINFTYGECLWIEKNMNTLVSLQQLVQGTIGGAGGVSGSRMFFIVRDYSDLTKAIDPVDPDVRTLAALIARDYPGNKNYDQAKALFEYVRDEITYIDTPLTKHQYVQKPAATIQLKVGNCADKSILLSSSLMSIGFPVRLVLQDTTKTAEEVNKGAQFVPNHMLVSVLVGDQWHYADSTCPNCEFGKMGREDKAIVEMEVPAI